MPPVLDITSPEYLNQAVQQRQTAMQPAYQSALRRSRESLGARGMLDSGVGASQEGQIRQGFMRDLGQFQGQVQQQQSGVMEQRQRAKDNQNFQLALQRIAYERQREQQGDQERQARENAQRNLIGGIAGSGAGLLATYLTANPALGAAAGNAVSGGVNSMMPQQSSYQQPPSYMQSLNMGYGGDYGLQGDDPLSYYGYGSGG